MMAITYCGSNYISFLTVWKTYFERSDLKLVQINSHFYCPSIYIVNLVPYKFKITIHHLNSWFSIRPSFLNTVFRWISEIKEITHFSSPVVWFAKWTVVVTDENCLFWVGRCNGEYFQRKAYPLVYEKTDSIGWKHS